MLLVCEERFMSCTSSLQTFIFHVECVLYSEIEHSFKKSRVKVVFTSSVCMCICMCVSVSVYLCALDLLRASSNMFVLLIL